MNVHVLKQDRRTMHATCPPCRRTVARGCAGKCKNVKENGKTKYIIIYRLNSENVIKRSVYTNRFRRRFPIQNGKSNVHVNNLGNSPEGKCGLCLFCKEFVNTYIYIYT